MICSSRAPWSRVAMALAKLGVSSVFFWWLFRRTSWEELRLVWEGISWWLVGIAVSVYLLKQLVSVLRWRIIAHAGDFGGLSLGRYCQYYWIGMFFNLVLPTSVGGDVVRAYYLAEEWTRYPQALATVVTDRLFGLWILLISFGLEVVLIDSPAIPATVMHGGIGMAILGLWVALAFPWICRLLKKVQLHPLSRVLMWIENKIYRGGVFLPILCLSFMAQALVLLAFKLISISLGITLTWPFLILFFTLDGIVTALPISLGGIGLREGVAVFCLSQLGLPASVGLSFSWVFFLIILLTSLPGGLIYLFVLRKGNKPSFALGRPRVILDSL